MTYTKAKAVASAIGTVATALTAAFADNVFTGNEIASVTSTVVVAILSIYAVYKVPNKPVNNGS